MCHTTSHRSHLTAVLIATIFATGILEHASGQTTSIRDSAGVRIVEHASLPDITAFQLGDPIYQVGWAPGDPEFATLRGGILLSDGRAVVGDLGTSQLIILSTEGVVDTTMGGRGQGPQEIGGLNSISWLPVDTILIHDSGNGRLAYYTPEGFVRSRSVGPGMTGYGSLGLGLQGRSYLLLKVDPYPLYFEEPWFQGYVARYSLDFQRTDTLAQLDFAPRMTEGQAFNPMRAFGHATSTRNAIVTTRGDLSQVRVKHLTDNSEHIFRWTEDPRVLTDSLWAEYEAYRAARTSGQSEAVARMLPQGERGAVDEPIPYTNSLYGDTRGNVWVSEYSIDIRHPNRLRVFGPEGDWLGWVELPDRFQIFYIDDNRILGVQRNDFDVEAVTVLPILE